ncbi:MAG: glycosyltransferase family 2 protein [Akkermansia sp.]|nr:glycosyltransferase family 2 protein [Akkermansia sp.]MBR2313444.1 glycosyltransferase family 2 protein [Akkermansia sp.]
MTAKPPYFSVVIPAYKCADFIQRTLQSVYTQTEPDFEIIVVNDGSPDNLAEVLQHETDPRLRIITQDNGGECAARNRGVREAKGQFIAFLDGDDAWLPNHLATARTFFEKFPDFDWYSTRPERVSDISSACLTEKSDFREEFWAVNWFAEGDSQTSSSSAVIRRAAIEGRDLFPRGVKMFGDGIGWARFATGHRMMGTCYSTTALYRIWGGSATDTFLANSTGSRSGAALDAFLIHQEMAAAPDCPEEAKLFYRRASLYNWWIRSRNTSLKHWLHEIHQRRHVTGAFLTLWLKFCAHFSHFFALSMGKIVRLQFNAVERRMAQIAEKDRRKLSD